MEGFSIFFRLHSENLFIKICSLLECIIFLLYMDRMYLNNFICTWVAEFMALINSHALWQVAVQTTQMKMTPVKGFAWESFQEYVASNADSSLPAIGLLEQINTTRDNTDYLWYTTRWDIPFPHLCLML